MITDIESAIRAYLPQTIHMSLATSVDNKPWVREVHFSYDAELNLYFRSLASRRHSREIAQNPHVAGNIVVQHQLGERPRGVYFEGIAELLQDVDAEHPAYISYRDRFATTEAILEEAKLEEGHKFYQIRVGKYYLFDGRESSPSQKYELTWPAN